MTTERGRAALTLVVGALALVLVGCGADAPAPGASSRSSSAPSSSASPGSSPSASSGTPTGVPTLTPIALPPAPPPTGRLLADLRQSSRDVALGRMEVWLGNDTRRDVTPVAIRYRDPRFHRPVAGERLRLDPTRSERGYPLTLPLRPSCGVPASAPGARPTVIVAYVVRGRPGTHRVTLRVGDDNDIVARYAAARCLGLAVARVAPLSFEDAVPVSANGQTGTLTLVARPRGVRGHTLRIDTVAGTPLFSAAGRSAWAPHARVRGDGPPVRIRLPVQPARCDDHVFMEAAGATAFLVGLHLDGRAGELVVRMSPAGTSAAITFARSACGL